MRKVTFPGFAFKKLNSGAELKFTGLPAPVSVRLKVPSDVPAAIKLSSFEYVRVVSDQGVTSESIPNTSNTAVPVGSSPSSEFSGVRFKVAALAVPTAVLSNSTKPKRGFVPESFFVRKYDWVQKGEVSVREVVYVSCVGDNVTNAAWATQKFKQMKVRKILMPVDVLLMARSQHLPCQSFSYVILISLEKSGGFTLGPYAITLCLHAQPSELTLETAQGANRKTLQVANYATLILKLKNIHVEDRSENPPGPTRKYSKQRNFILVIGHRPEEAGPMTYGPMELNLGKQTLRSNKITSEILP